MDQMVLKTQKWLNNKFGSNISFGTVVEDGETGWGTIYGLTRAFQICLGITDTADNFGPTTERLFNQRFPNGIPQQKDNDSSTSEFYGIIQGALWCKGYSTGASDITLHFYDGTGSAVKQLKQNAGISYNTATVTLNLMKALLSMDQFVTLSDYGGTVQISAIQRTLNSKYEAYIGLSPCDGLYGRRINESMIKVLQAIEGYSVEDASGNFGDGTKANLQNLILPEITNSEAVLLVRYGLVCNGYTDVNILSSTWDSALAQAILTFQADLALPQTGIVDVNTWMSLLLSKGNPDRSCLACDTRFEMTDDKLAYIDALGMTIIGRYLSGGDFKELRRGEAQRILSSGKQFFPIFQESGADAEYFNAQNGIYDAESATAAAMNYGVPENSVIYFAVDFDAQDSAIQTSVMPYFAALASNMSQYSVGIYGTRNVCSKVIAANYAEAAFVSDMSTGYSGNMGYKIPSQWVFDQFYEDTVETASGSWDIDKVAYSGYRNAVNSLKDFGYLGGQTQNVRDGRNNMFWEEMNGISSSNGRAIRVLATSMNITVHYNSNTSDAIGRVKLTNGQDVIRLFRVSNGGDVMISVPISYGDVFVLSYESVIEGAGLVAGDFVTYVTTDALV